MMTEKIIISLNYDFLLWVLFFFCGQGAPRQKVAAKPIPKSNKSATSVERIGLQGL